MKKQIVEFIGTFFLVLTIGMTVLSTPAGVIPPIAIGAILMTMVFAGGHISGAHYNPAVTLAVLIRGKICPLGALSYWIAQLFGAAVAAKTVLYLKGHPAADALVNPVPHVMLAEFLFTFALAWVVLNVATADSTKNNSFYGLAIGFTVMAGAFAVGTISGGAFNPAVVFGAIILGLLPAAKIGIYLIATLGGGAVAAILFRCVNTDEKIENP
ncbi:MAG: aquaporin [Chthoniobacterales bacterium]